MLTRRTLIARYTTFWQYADSGPNPGDQDEFNGSLQGLKKYVLPSWSCNQMLLTYLVCSLALG